MKAWYNSKNPKTDSAIVRGLRQLCVGRKMYWRHLRPAHNRWGLQMNSTTVLKHSYNASFFDVASHEDINM